MWWDGNVERGDIAFLLTSAASGLEIISKTMAKPLLLRNSFANTLPANKLAKQCIFVNKSNLEGCRSHATAYHQIYIY
jgi:hypothetical protein